MPLYPFTSIRGHRNQVAALQRLVAKGQPGHAYLFEGPEGVGKDTVAQAFLARLACLDAAPEAPDPCGHCRSCHALQRGEHPDLTRLQRDGQFIKIEAVRNATQRLRYEPVLGRIKGVIIEDADALGETAANALLKTLEEPWPGTVFVLVTSKPQVLLDTIRSRCQVLRFAELSPDDIAALLVQEGHAQELAVIAAQLAGGSMKEGRVLCDPQRMALVDLVTRFALGLGQQPPTDAAGFVDLLAARLSNVGKPEADEATEPPEGKAPEGKPAENKAAESKTRKEFTRLDLQWTLDVLRAVMRDAVLVASGLDPVALPNARHGAALQALAERTETTRLIGVVDACQRLEERMNLNPNPRLALAALLVEAGMRLGPRA
jgi:DNA polymerase III delta' subunit